MLVSTYLTPNYPMSGLAELKSSNICTTVPFRSP